MSWNVRIGINPISWMNDDLPSLGGETPLETALSEGRQIGYEGFELGNKFPKEGPGLKAKLDTYGLACVSGWYSGFLAELAPGQSHEQAVAAEVERCRDHMLKLQYNGARVVVYGECAGTVQGQIDTPVTHRPVFASEALWTAYAARLNAFGAHLLTTYGLKLAYHHHMGAYVESPGDIDRLMALTDPASVFLLFDTGHAYYGGAADPVPLLQRHIRRVVHVHCKDVRPAVLARALNRDTSFLDAVVMGVFTVPGDGSVDYPAVLGPIARAGYEGWLVVEAEQDPAIAIPAVHARKGHDYLARITRPLFT